MTERRVDEGVEVLRDAVAHFVGDRFVEVSAEAIRLTLQRLQDLEEALRRIRWLHHDDHKSHTQLLTEAVLIALRALDTQEPRQPEWCDKHKQPISYCPRCRAEVPDQEGGRQQFTEAALASFAGLPPEPAEPAVQEGERA